MSRQTVFVGLSGGVDSSLAAHRLCQAGHRVVGVYMKNWTASVGQWQCPWREDYLSAKRVAVELGIEFLVFDFEVEYRQLVVDHLLTEYQAGRTPNPDIRCNSEIKFKLFVRAARDKGADLVATGHYAATDGQRLFRPADPVKDQTYFLYRIDPAVLSLVSWPLAELTKRQVRAQAAAIGLSTANRPDSQGICFVGQVGLADFLRNYLPKPPRPGPIVAADTGTVLGEHPGAIFFTLGQRQGLGLGSRAASPGLPYYVVGKDMATNTVYVSQKLNHPNRWTDSLYLADCHWLVESPATNVAYQVRYRHGGRLLPARIRVGDQARAVVRFERAVPATATGQSAVVYHPTTGEVLGGGVVAENPADLTTVDPDDFPEVLEVGSGSLAQSGGGQ